MWLRSTKYKKDRDGFIKMLAQKFTCKTHSLNSYLPEHEQRENQGLHPKSVTVCVLFRIF